MKLELFTARVPLPVEGCRAAALEAQGALQAQGAALVPWLCTDTCSPRAVDTLQAVPGSSGCAYVPSAVTLHS